MRYLLIVGKNRDSTNFSRTFAAGQINEIGVRSSLGGVLARFRYRDD